MRQGVIFIYVADNFKGDLKEKSEEGCSIEWIDVKDLSNLKQFPQNFCNIQKQTFGNDAEMLYNSKK